MTTSNNDLYFLLPVRNVEPQSGQNQMICTQRQLCFCCSSPLNPLSNLLLELQKDDGPVESYVVFMISFAKMKKKGHKLKTFTISANSERN